MVLPGKSDMLNQMEHHKAKTFKEEVEGFIKQSDVIEYNEEYFWR